MIHLRNSFGFNLIMKLLRHIVLIFLFSVLIDAQTTVTTPNSPTVLQPSITIIIGIFGMLFFLLLSLYLYTKFFNRNTPDILSSRHSSLSRSKFSGIDKSVIDLIPFFKFSSLKGSKEGLECSVCLSVFGDSEVLRLLPKCKHAFHMNCIDEWLERHSSCPLCRYRFDSTDFTSFVYTGSLRYNGISSPQVLMDAPKLELFIEREEHGHGSTKFKFGRSFRKLNKLRDEDSLATKGDIAKKFHKFKHKIVVEDIFLKRRWSDLNSSDLTLLNSEMLNDISSKRFDTNSPNYGLLLEEQLAKIKEDMETKRTFESKRSKTNHARLDFWSDTFSPSFSNDENETVGSKLLALSEKRSMSEITILTRSKDFRVRSNITTELSSLRTNAKDERIQRLWLPIARRTLQWFAVRDNNLEKSDTLNV